jgi:hypothetical protein
MLVLEHVVYVATDEHRLVHLGELDAAESGAGQQRAHPAGVGEGESSRRPGWLAEVECRHGVGEPEGKAGILIAVAPAEECQPAAAPSALLRLPNAAAGSSKNMTPNLLSTTSKIPAWNGVHLDAFTATQATLYRPAPQRCPDRCPMRRSVRS